MDYCKGGELLNYISENNGLEESDAQIITHQLIYALTYLHSIGICHRDIKPENFLLMSENNINHIKMIDFGLAVKTKKKEDHMNLVTGSPFYIAPEVLLEDYTMACDNWSIGILLYVMLAGKYPFMANTNDELFELIKEGTYDTSEEFWDDYSENALELMKSLL